MERQIQLLKTSLIGKVNNLPHFKSEALFPVFEAVVNSIHAIEEFNSERNGRITVRIIREQINSAIPPKEHEKKIIGFEVEDNGIGFTEKNVDSFCISDTQYKLEKDKKTFWKLVKLGGELRGLHLLESPKVEQFITAYPKDGDNTVTRKIVKKDFEIIDEEKQIGRVWINDTQYFDKVPVVSWEFYIGGYQPAQKWLKDRKGRQLSYEDIRHYQKIIVALAETDRIMKKIDSVVEF